MINANVASNAFTGTVKVALTDLTLRGNASETQAKSDICGNLFVMFSNNFHGK